MSKTTNINTIAKQNKKKTNSKSNKKTILFTTSKTQLVYIFINLSKNSNYWPHKPKQSKQNKTKPSNQNNIKKKKKTNNVSSFVNFMFKYV